MTFGAEIIKSALSDDSGLSALIGSRAYLHQAPQGVTMPCVTYFQVSSDINNSLSGPADIIRERWQIDCWADRYSDAMAVSAAVKTAVFSAVGENDLESVVLLSELAQFEAEEALHRVVLDFSLWHS